MKIICTPRGGGKTSELIKLSAETGARIIVAHKENIANIIYRAKLLGYEIPRPYAISDYNDCMRGVRRNHINEKVLIDDVDDVISSIIQADVDTVTFTL